MNKALVVDDSRSARFALARLLKKKGLEVVEAASGAEAMEVLAGSAADVIFMDHVMPEMDGLQTTKAIRLQQAYAELPVVMCSSNEGEEHETAAQEAGATAVLVKPPSEEDLNALLLRLDKSSAMPEEADAQSSSDSADNLNGEASDESAPPVAADSVEDVVAATDGVESTAVDMKQIRREVIMMVDMRLKQSLQKIEQKLLAGIDERLALIEEKIVQTTEPTEADSVNLMLAQSLEKIAADLKQGQPTASQQD